jgi:hypothetical protein
MREIKMQNERKAYTNFMGMQKLLRGNLKLWSMKRSFEEAVVL